MSVEDRIAQRNARFQIVCDRRDRLGRDPYDHRPWREESTEHREKRLAPLNGRQRDLGDP